MKPNPSQIRALLLVAESVIEAVKVAGDQGAPGGYIYAAMMGHGCSLQQFESIMSCLCRTGKLRKSGQLYFWVADLKQVEAA